MGKEARAREARHRKAFADMVSAELDKWAFPPSVQEEAWLSELAAAPRVTVRRQPDGPLIQGGMRPKECHLNCSEQAENDPRQQTRHVLGWWVQGPILVLHSVIEVGARWYCITPQLAPMPTEFEFIPDDQLSWVDQGEGKRDIVRYGLAVPVGLRKYPQASIEMRDRLRELIAAGMDSADAWRAVDGDLGARLMALPGI